MNPSGGGYEDLKVVPPKMNSTYNPTQTNPPKKIKEHLEFGLPTP